MERIKATEDDKELLLSDPVDPVLDGEAPEMGHQDEGSGSD